MAHDPKALLLDIITACNHIMAFTEGFSFEDFTDDALVKSAVNMQFIVIGEALMRTRNIENDFYANISDADRIVAFRHIIAHGYDVIVDEIVWEVVRDKIPQLLEEATALLNAQQGAEV